VSAGGRRRRIALTAIRLFLPRYAGASFPPRPEGRGIHEGNPMKPVIPDCAASEHRRTVQQVGDGIDRAPHAPPHHAPVRSSRLTGPRSGAMVMDTHSSLTSSAENRMPFASAIRMNISAFEACARGC
jgi:hypothetical protein